uniref:Secreted protein n=1 Tax=Anguilla anguilla TaxID=7936 RepID=A0A0E9S5E2_ANGAN
MNRWRHTRFRLIWFVPLFHLSCSLCRNHFYYTCHQYNSIRSDLAMHAAIIIKNLKLTHQQQVICLSYRSLWTI